MALISWSLKYPTKTRVPLSPTFKIEWATLGIFCFPEKNVIQLTTKGILKMPSSSFNFENSQQKVMGVFCSVLKG